MFKSSSKLLYALERLGLFVVFTLEVFKWTFKRPNRFRILTAHVEKMGVASIPIIVLSSFAIGMIISLQLVNVLSMFRAEPLAGSAVGITMARELAPMVGADPNAAEQAARVAKADLSSEMVYEFPELQGLMGRYYAQAAGFTDEIAAAAQEHYAPLGPSDDVPTAPVSVAVALAEKIDKLTGFWAIDEKPTGSKDPFALRRAALGVIRILVENDVSRDLFGLIYFSIWKKIGQPLTDKFERVVPEFGAFLLNASSSTFQQRLSTEDPVAQNLLCYAGGSKYELEIVRSILALKLPERTADLLAFLHDRLKVHLKDQGIRHDIIDACIAMEGNDDLTLLVKRARALSDTLKTDDGENLIQAFKRANNILSQAEAGSNIEYSHGGDVKFSETDEERALFKALDQADAVIAPAMRWAAAL
jgi:glycyl-tRNA synthetase beta chain